ncbi:MAG: hypothetical protein ACYS8W_12045 [Planctomycetota bacterium]|jgi:hypothetical protein
MFSIIKRIISNPLTIAVLAVSVPFAVIAAEEWYEKEKKIRSQLENDIKLVKELDAAIKVIDPEVKSEFRIFNIADLYTKAPDFCGLDPRVKSPEEEGSQIGFEEFDEDEEPWMDPETIIEIIQSTTGEDAWPEEDGFGTMSYHRGQLIVVNTPEICKKIEEILTEMRQGNFPIAVEIYFLAIPDKKLEEYRSMSTNANYSVLDGEATKKLIEEAATGKDIKIIQSARVVQMNRQRSYVFGGESKAYIADEESSGGGIGLVAAEQTDPVTFALNTGVFVDIRSTSGGKETPTHISLRAALTKLIKFSKVETTVGPLQIPEVDMQITNGNITIPPDSAALVGGSRSGNGKKNTQAMVLVIPNVLVEK